MIYISGDSFATGEELNDNRFTTYPGDGWLLDHKPWKEWHKQRTKELIAAYGSYHKYIEKCKDDSWGSMVSNHYGMPYVNTAISGASMMTILVNTQNSLTALKNQNIKVEKAFIMLTSPYRISVFKNEGESYNPETSIETLCPTFTDLPCSQSGLTYMKSWVAAEDENAMLSRWMMHFNAIRHAVIALAGIEPIFLDSQFVEQNELHNMEGRMTTPVAKELWRSVEPYFPDVLNRMSTFNGNDPRMPLGHYGWATHNRFAKSLALRYPK
jgi:hypothetical protein